MPETPVRLFIGNQVARIRGLIGSPDAGPGIAVTDASGVERVRVGQISDTDYGLKVVSSDGTTVVIDGTSNMFKIAATGSLITAAATSTAVAADLPDPENATVDLATGLTYAPALHLYWRSSPSATAAVLMPHTFGAAGINRPGLNIARTGSTQVVATNQTRVTYTEYAYETSMSYGDTPVRYYVMKEAAI